MQPHSVSTVLTTMPSTSGQEAPLAQVIAAGKAAPIPSLAEQAEAYGVAREFFGMRGWIRLSQAHAARTTHERNLYNRHNKGGAACLAFGPGAGSSGSGFSWRNETNLERWSKLVEAGELPVARIRPLPADFQARSQIIASLEAGQINLDEIEIYAPGFTALSCAMFDAWERAGLLERQGHALETTVAGDFWMNTLMAGLVTVLEQLKGRDEANR